MYQRSLPKRDDAAFVMSFTVHLVAMLWMSLVVIHTASRPEIKPIVITQNEEVVLEEVIPEITSFSEVETNISEEVSEVSEESSLQISEEIVSVEVPEVIEVEESFTPSVEDTNFDSLNGVGDSVGTGVSSQQSLGGAIDRLTLEIIRNSETKDLNVIWLLDASISVSAQREEVKTRFNKILQELALSENTTNEVNHVIASFGSGLQILNPIPSRDIDILQKAIDNIMLDESGVENVFSAVGELSKKYISSKDMKAMIIIFTDEVGDDIKNLELVANIARKNNVTVYAVAPPAPFGRSIVEFKYVDPDPKFSQEERWVQIQQGPESLFQTVLNLRSLPIDRDAIDSGFGSFGLSKLCADTGGLYFSVHPNRSNNKVKKKDIAPLASNITMFFNGEDMIRYRPDYGSIAAQTRDASTNKIKAALVNACQIPVDIVGEQTMDFTAFSEGEFAEQLGMAQRFSAKIEPKINMVWNILQEVEKSSDNIKEKRWDASYHLAMGRILAAKCRIELYNLMLANAKSGLKKENEKSNTWTLEYYNEVDSKNSQIDKAFQSAQKHLQYVVDNFPNTPWSYVAALELETPMGYKWVEGYKEPPQMGEGGGGNNMPQDDQRRKIQQRPMRKVDKI